MRVPRPDEHVRVALLRHLCCVSDDKRQSELEQVLAVDRTAIKRCAEDMETIRPERSVPQ